jgi:hypothetical protein
MFVQDGATNGQIKLLSIPEIRFAAPGALTIELERLVNRSNGWAGKTK